MSNFEPNSFQVPNAYIDQFWHALTTQERSLLIYILRHGDGPVFLSAMRYGCDDGFTRNHGAGLTADELDKALSALVGYGLILCDGQEQYIIETRPEFMFIYDLGAVDPELAPDEE